MLLITTPKNSNIIVNKNQFQLSPGTCVSENKESLGSECKLEFTLASNQLSADDNSLVNSFSISTTLAEDSQIIIDYLSKDNEPLGTIGYLTSTRNKSEFNVPSNFDPLNIIEIIFWNKSAPIISSNSVNEPAKVTYCSTTYT